MRTSLIASEFNPLFSSIIKKRNFLIRAKQSQKNEYEMREIISRVKPFLDITFSERGAAKFIIKNFSDIRDLIVEKDTETIKKLDDLYKRASEIVAQTSLNI